MIFERYEMFASTLNEHFPFGHTFNEDVMENYGYKKFVFTVHVRKYWGCSGFDYFKSDQSRTRPDLGALIRPKLLLVLGQFVFWMTEQYA